MNKKVFTLIKLLAGIVILSIILIIIIPQVINREEDDGKAFKATAESLIKEAIVKENHDTTGEEDKIYTIEDGEFVGDSIPIKGKLPDNGTIYVTKEGKIGLSLSNDKWCAYKSTSYDSIVITPNKNNCKSLNNFDITKLLNDSLNSFKNMIHSITFIPPDECFNFEDGVIYEYLDWVEIEPDEWVENTACQFENIEIPSTIGGVTVTEIGEAAFYEDGLTSVTIPNSVTSIGKEAFYQNELNSVTIGSGVTSVGEYAFYNNQLTSVTIPNSVISIEKGAFSETQLASVTIGSGITSIGEHAFFGNQLTSVTIPNSVTSIGEYAFYQNELKSVTIPNSVTSIGEGAFNLNLLPDNQAFIYARNPDGSENTSILVSYGGLRQENVVIPTGVTSIGDFVFALNALTSVTVPNSVTSIGKDAFFWNYLTSVTIPNSVTSIGESAFYNNQLTSITIPDSVKSIGDGAFGYNQLTSVTIPNSVTSIGEGAFNLNLLPDNQAFIYARNPDGSENTSILVSYGGLRKENVVIPTGVTSIGNNAGCGKGLTSVTIPNSVTSIGKNAFFGNYLTSVTIPNSVTSIGNNAFDSVQNSLTSITIPANVTLQDDSISYTFYSAYNPLKQAGTYTAPSQYGTWTKQP